jgi:superfamily II DNA or RNA helicase
MVLLEFDRGTLLLSETEAGGDLSRLELPQTTFDPRIGRHRAPACAYRPIILDLRKAGIEYEDNARRYEELPLPLKISREPFPYQSEALEVWWKQRQTGVVVLPTGAGKTFVAQLIMQKVGRSALVVTPTLDLMHQWYSVLGASFDQEIGLIGGGEYDVRTLTVCTYDSAYLHMDRLGNRFGLIVFDECHHLPGESYALAAEACLAPFRLGLTATPERADGGHFKYPRLIGPIVYRQEIKQLAGDYLSDYQTVVLTVQLTEAERDAYQRERGLYKEFLQKNNVRLSSNQDWARFLALTSRSSEGRRALEAFRNQKVIVQASEAKFQLLETLLVRHRYDRVLIFTNDNATVYQISRRFLIPAITHQTKVKERHALLEGLNQGIYPFLVTSKVLNEGIDVPSANVAIVLSGSGSVREHVQRLGRILRRAKEKQAILYEVVAEETGEVFTSSRRTQHSAYQ